MATPRSPWAVAAAATAFLLPVAYSPSVRATFWSPKMAILVVAGVAGLTRLPVLLRTEQLRRTTIAAIAFGGAATLSTLVASRPIEAVFGLYNWGTGLIFIACLVGVWALGAAAGDDRMVVIGLLAGCSVSAATALLQTAVTIPFPVLENEARATGLAGNAVHLGSIAAIGLVLCAWHVKERWYWLAGVIGFAATVQVSGTRTALAVTIVVVVAVGVRRSPRLLPHLVAATTVGFLLGNAIASAADFATASGRATEERALAAGTSSTIRVRVDVWLYARHAVLERPLLGAGPGRFRAATSADRTRSVAAAEGHTVIYADGHNLFVEHLVTTGVIGVAALLSWMVLALRRARGPLLAVGLVVAGCGLAQPQSVGTTPLLFLALGAAAAIPLPATSRRATFVDVPVMAIGVVAAVALVVGDVSLQRLRDTFALADGRRADVLLRPWPEPAVGLATAHEFRAIDADDDAARRRERAEVRSWLLEAVRRDPTRPSLWLALAAEERVDGLDALADEHEREAHRHDPFALGLE